MGGVSDPMGARHLCSQRRPYRGLAALGDQSVCPTGSTSYPVPHPSCLSLRREQVHLLSKPLIKEAGAERRGVGRHRWARGRRD